MLTRLAKKRRVFWHNDQMLGAKIWAQITMFHCICSFLLQNELLQLDCVCRFFKQSVDEYLFQNVTFSEHMLHKKCEKNPHFFNQIQKLSIEEVSSSYLSYTKKYGKYGTLFFPRSLKSLNLITLFYRVPVNVHHYNLPPNLQNLKVRDERSLVFIRNCSHLSKLEISRPVACNLYYIIHHACFLNLQVLKLGYVRENSFTLVREKSFTNNLSVLVHLRKLYLYNTPFDQIAELPPNLQVFCAQYFPFKEGLIFPHSLKKIYVYKKKNFTLHAQRSPLLIPSSIRVLQYVPPFFQFESADKVESLQMFVDDESTLEYTFKCFSHLSTLSLDFYKFLPFHGLYLPYLLKLSLIDFRVTRSYTTFDFPATLEYLHWEPGVRGNNIDDMFLCVTSNSKLKYLAINFRAYVRIYSENLKFVLFIEGTNEESPPKLEVFTEDVFVVVVEPTFPILPTECISSSLIETFLSHTPFPAYFFSHVSISRQDSLDSNRGVWRVKINNTKQRNNILSYWYRLMSICRMHF